jgi:hypothetical protein
MDLAYSKAGLDSSFAAGLAQAQERQGWSDLNWSDPLQLYDVEGRAVGVIYPDEGPGFAWVWQGEWYFTPALAAKASIEGARYSPLAFMQDFPGADLLSLEAVARGAVERLTNADPLLTPPASELPDRELISTVYALTRYFLWTGETSIAAIAAKIVPTMALSRTRALQLLRNAYFCAFEDRGLALPYRPNPLDAESAILAAVERATAPRWEDPEEVYLAAVRKAAINYAGAKSAQVAKGLQRKLSLLPPPYIIGDGERYRTAWSEFSAWISVGVWRSMDGARWEALLEPALRAAIDALKPEEATLLTLAGRWWNNDYENDPQPNERCDETIRRLLLEALADIAEV